LQETDRFLAGRVITKGIVNLRLNQAGDGGRAVRINNNIGVFNVRGGQRADLLDLAVFDQDAVSACVRRLPFSRQDFSDIDDGQLHARLLDQAVQTHYARFAFGGGLRVSVRQALTWLIIGNTIVIQ